MSDLDRKLAEAAAIADQLKKAKWSKGTAPEPARKPVTKKDLPAGVVTQHRKHILREYMDKQAASIARDYEREIRRDLNEIIKAQEGDFDEQLHAVGDQIQAAEDCYTNMRKLFEEMRPKQFVIEHNGDTTQLGEVTETQHKDYPKLVRATQVKDRKGKRKNIALKGPAGSGKSTAGFNLADMLGYDFFYIGQTLMPHQIEGYVRQGDGVYQSTFFTQAYQRPSVLMLEEMDAWSPQATLVANPALANGYMALPNGEMIERHPDCIIIACMNTWGTGATAEYVGRNKLDAAFMDRFAFKFDWGYDDNLERAAAGNDDLVTKVQICRMNAEKAGIKILISPRASIDIADMCRQGFDEREAFELNFLSSLNHDQRKTVLAGVELD